MVAQTQMSGSAGSMGSVFDIAKTMAESEQRLKLEDTPEIVAARQSIDDCKAAIGEAQSVVDDWAAKVEEAKAAADEAERSAGKAAFEGSDLSKLGASVAAKRATVQIAQDALNQAAQDLEQRHIDHQRTKCDLWRLQIAQQRARTEADMALLRGYVAELEARPGGLHAGVQIKPVNLHFELEERLRVAEREVQTRQAKLDGARRGEK